MPFSAPFPPPLPHSNRITPVLHNITQLYFEWSCCATCIPAILPRVRVLVLVISLLVFLPIKRFVFK